MVRTVITAYPAARTIHLVVDHLNPHREKALTDHVGLVEVRRLWRCLTVYYTPEHGSWLKQAEIELGRVARQCLGTRRLATLDRRPASLRPAETHQPRAVANPA